MGEQCRPLCVAGSLVDKSESAAHHADEQGEETDDGEDAGCLRPVGKLVDYKPEEDGNRSCQRPGGTLAPSEKVNDLSHDDQPGEYVAAVGNPDSQTVELFVERGFD